MDPSTSPERPRKRRAINACIACRTSKVRCDGRRPCQRCARNEASCIYHDAAKDPNVLRIERLEAEVVALKKGLEEAAVRSWNEVPNSRTPISAHSTADTGPSVRSNTSIGVAAVPVPGTYAASLSNVSHGLASSHVMNTSGTTCNVIEQGLVTWDQASFWFRRHVISSP